MLRRDTDARPRRRFGSEAGEPDPFPRDVPAPAVAPTAPLGGWTAPLSYLALEPRLVAELARASLASRGVAALRSGEVAVGAMLASLAIRGDDVLLDEILPLAGAELRVNRYRVGQLTPVAVHAVPTAASLLRALAHCATGAVGGETWEAVAHDGRAPVAIASAQTHELRWLQPPGPDAPHDVAWVEPTTGERPPGSTMAGWQTQLDEARATPAPAGGEDGAWAPVGSALAASPGRTLVDDPDLRLRPPPSAEQLTQQILAAVGDTVDQALSSALLELELDPSVLGELRDDSVLDRLVGTVARLEQQVAQVDFVTRELQALTTAVDELGDAVRSLVRQQWDHLPPAGIWTKLQRADDEVRRAVDELAAEVRGRLPRPGAR